MAAAASRGYSYLAITEHGEDLAINGSSREQMLAHRDRIRTVNEAYPDMTLLVRVRAQHRTETGPSTTTPSSASISTGVSLRSTRTSTSPPTRKPSASSRRWRTRQ